MRTLFSALLAAVLTIPAGPALAQGEVPGFIENQIQKQVLARIKALMRDTHPSVIAASGLGQVMARDMPGILSRLRATRDAIERAGDDDFTDAATIRATPFAWIKDAADRRVMTRHIADLEYLLNEMDRALERGDTDEIEQFREAIANMIGRIDRLAGQYGRSFDSLHQAPIVGLFEPNLSRTYTSKYGNIHWDQGYYGNKDKTIALGTLKWDPKKDVAVLTGTWGRKKSTYAGGFSFEFVDDCEFEGVWWDSVRPNVKVSWWGSCAAEEQD